MTVFYTLIGTKGSQTYLDADYVDVTERRLLVPWGQRPADIPAISPIWKIQQYISSFVSCKIYNYEI